MAKNLKPGGIFVHILPLGLSALILSFLALHHGTYSLVDRQQAAIAVWVVFGVLAAFGAIPRFRSPRIVWVAVFSLVALCAWTAIGLFWTESAERTFAEVARLGGYVGVLAFIAMAVGRRNWRLVAAGMLTAGVLVCTVAFASRIWPSAFPANDVINNLRIWRLSYPLGYWNAVGCWTAMSFVMCVAWSAHARSSLVRGAALAAAPVCLAALYLTFSRAALGGVTVGLFVLIAFARFRWLSALHAAAGLLAGLVVVIAIRPHTEFVRATGTAGAGGVLAVLLLVSFACAGLALLSARLELGPRLVMPERAARISLIVGGCVAVVVVGLLIASYGGRASREFRTTDLAPTATADARLTQLNGNRVNIWRSGWRAFKSQPLHGIGAGAFGYWWNRDGNNAENVRDTHNLYLEALDETGAIGLLLLLVLLATLAYAAILARAGLRSDSDVGIHAALLAVFAVFVAQAGVDWMWESTAVAVLAFVAIAVAAASGSQRVTRVLEPSRRLALTAIAGAAALLQLPGLASAQHLADRQRDFRLHNYAAALSEANSAIDSAPWSASAYGQRALAFEAAGNLHAAARDLAIAQRKEPTNWVWPLLAVRVQVKLGDSAQAQKALRTAKRLRPHAEVFDGK